MAEFFSQFSFLLSEQAFFQWFSQFTYQPHFVYSFIVIFMFLSSFGLPIPEEFTLISTGFVCYMASHPGLYPPPTPDAVSVNTLTAMWVAFLSVFGSDLVVFSLGKFFGKKITEKPLFNRLIKPEHYEKIKTYTKKYSFWACGIFRFTPGIRFPGHLSCGILGISYLRFVLIDGFAAIFSVPTQIWLVSVYGEYIIKYVKRFNTAIFILVIAALVVFLIRRYLKYKKLKRARLS